LVADEYVQLFIAQVLAQFQQKTLSEETTETIRRLVFGDLVVEAGKN